MSLPKTIRLGAASLARSAQTLRLVPLRATRTPIQAPRPVVPAQQTFNNAWLSAQNHLSRAVQEQQNGIGGNGK